VTRRYHSPVNLEVCKKNTIKRREHGQHVGVLVELSEIFAVLIHCPGFIPASSHTWVILPVMEEVEMIRICIVDSDHCEMLLEMRYPPAVDDRPRFRLRFSYRMPSVPR
jgi:hypothetical protein